jgi:hypothetical protein
MTRISYGDQTAIHVLFESGKTEDFILNPNEEVKEQIKKLLFESDIEKREKVDASSDVIAEVHLKLPNDRLKVQMNNVIISLQYFH